MEVLFYLRYYGMWPCVVCQKPWNFHPEDEGSWLLQNTGIQLPHYKEWHPKNNNLKFLPRTNVSFDFLLHSFKWFVITNLQGHIRIKHLTIDQLHRHQSLCDGTIEHYLCPPLSLHRQLGTCSKTSAREGTAGRWYNHYKVHSERKTKQNPTSLNSILPLR